MDSDEGMGMAKQQNSALQKQDVQQTLEMMKARRDEHIRSAEKITRLLYYVDAHPECLEMLKLLRETI